MTTVIITGEWTYAFAVIQGLVFTACAIKEYYAMQDWQTAWMHQMLKAQELEQQEQAVGRLASDMRETLRQLEEIKVEILKQMRGDQSS